MNARPPAHTRNTDVSRSIPIAFMFALLACSAAAGAGTGTGVKYDISPMTGMRRAPVSGTLSVQVVKLTAVPGANDAQVRRMNAALQAGAKRLVRYGVECGKQTHTGLWRFEARLADVILTPKYLSVVYGIWSACGNSPDLWKTAIVLSLRNGSPLAPSELLKAEVGGGYDPEAASRSRLLLPAPVSEMLFEDSAKQGIEYPENCTIYLTSVGYNVWPDKDKLVFYPAFSQPNSHCQQEYWLRYNRD